MSTAWWITGDTRSVVADLAAAGVVVDLVLTSPPFLALRSYLPDEHPDKAKEIGSEPTPAAFTDTLLELTAGWRSILAPHGSIAVELGDTYAGSGGAGGDYTDGGLRDGQAVFSGSAAKRTRLGVGDDDRPARIGRGDEWPEDKSLTMIPESYRLGLAYGINPLTGEPSPAGRWRVRNVVRWVRPNPPVGALGDKFRPATSDMAIACVSRTRWFDLDAVRTPATEGKRTEWTYHSSDADDSAQPGNTARKRGGTLADNPAGAPPLDWWSISPGGYSGSHYAVFPSELCVRPIEAMCPRRVCRTCGEPSRRTSEAGFDLDESRPQAKRAMELAEAHGLTPDHLRAIRATGISDVGKAKHTNNGVNADETQRLALEAKTALGGYFREFTMTSSCSTTTTGWSSCSCPGTDGIRLDGYHTGTGWRPGIVLDPFGGSGTTGLVATGHGRDAILIDLDHRNVELAHERLGMFLTETTAADLPALLNPSLVGGTV